MMILFQVLCIAVIAILTAKFAPEPSRGRLLNVLKAIVTVLGLLAVALAPDCP